MNPPEGGAVTHSLLSSFLTLRASPGTVTRSSFFLTSFPYRNGSAERREKETGG